MAFSYILLLLSETNNDQEKLSPVRSDASFLS